MEGPGPRTAAQDTAVDTGVIGGGQAGLAAGHELQRAGRSFVVLDAASGPGDSWRRRWDSLRLFTPAGYSRLPGMAFPAPRGAFPTKDEMADYLTAYAGRHQIPVEHRTRVERLERHDKDLVVTAGHRTWRARHVIAATGAHTTARIPAFAGELAATTTQLSSLDYRNPDHLPPGAVLVVGAGNSGAEIALDLATRSSPSRRVHLAGRDVGHVPAAGSSTALFPAMQLLGSWGAHLVHQRLSGRGDPLGRVRPRDLSDAGVTRQPPMTGTRHGAPAFADGSTVDVATVIWCTGLGPDLRWIRLPVFDGAGQLRHRHGITCEPGLYCSASRTSARSPPISSEEWVATPGTSSGPCRARRRR